VTITAAGERRLAKADQEFREAEDAFFGELTADEREQLHRMLSRLREASGASLDPDC
jgi:DNA-binding MarR family transcriptional regulator